MCSKRRLTERSSIALLGSTVEAVRCDGSDDADLWCGVGCDAWSAGVTIPAVIRSYVEFDSMDLKTWLSRHGAAQSIDGGLQGFESLPRNLC